MARLFPRGFFKETFTVVRHPVARLRSVFQFQRDAVWQLPAEMSFSDWLAELPAIRAQDPFYLDNHPRPMTEFVPEDCTVFHLEQGLDPLVDWLDQLAGATYKPRSIPLKNNFKQRMNFQGREIRQVSVTEEDRALIGRLYAEDFERFGYDAKDESEGAA